MDANTGFVNEYKPGLIAFTCSKCYKRIWLEPKIYEYYKVNGMCLDCKNARIK